MAAKTRCAVILVFIVSVYIRNSITARIPAEEESSTYRPTVVTKSINLTAHTVRPEAGTKNVTAHYCPAMCTVGNQTLCYPPPCPFPGCVDPAKYKPTDCCQYCPNGADCSAPDGSIIKWRYWRILEGKNCTCTDPGQQSTCI